MIIAHNIKAHPKHYMYSINAFVASGIDIHMYLDVGMTHFYRLALKTVVAWPEHTRSWINAKYSRWPKA